MACVVICHCSVSSAAQQFMSGMGDLWPIMKSHPDNTKCLLVNCTTHLTYKMLRKMYDVEWSEPGSNLRMSEEDTIYSWEMYLKDAES